MKSTPWMGLGLVIILILGCKQSPQEMVRGPANQPTPPPPVDDNKPTNVTDTKICNTKLQKQGSVYGAWGADFNIGKGKVHQTFKIENYTLTNQLTCSVDKKSLTVEARSNAAVTDSDIRILTYDHMERVFDDGKTKFRCTVQLESGENIQYSFQGPCLKLKSENRDILMIPEQAS